MNFVGGLPTTKNEHDYIFMVVDKFNKMCVWMPCKKTITGQEANLLFGQVWMHFGIPRSIISYRDKIYQCIMDYTMGEDGHKVEKIQSIPSTEKCADRSTQHDFGATSEEIQPEVFEDLE